MAVPETHYTNAGDAEIAYATVGDGPVDLVWAFGLMTHLELKWEEPSLAAMLGRFAEFSRVVLFDRRGCGLSDRGDRHLAPTLDERVEDLVAVLDAVGSTRAAVFGVSEGCALAALFAATHPERATRIVLYGGMTRLVRDDEHPWGALDEERLMAVFGPVFANWGTPAGAKAMVGFVAPSMAEDADYVDWFARQQRHSLSRDAVVEFMTMVAGCDMNDVLPAVRVPTLVLHRADDTAIPPSGARYVASRVPGARHVELPGHDHLPYVGDADAIVEAVREFVTGEPATGGVEGRQLVTLLATDATEPDPVALVRRHVRRLGGDEVTGPGGRTLARFGTATRAVRCGLALAGAARAAGVDLRVAVHTGECEVSDESVGGPAARLAEAMAALAGPGEVVATGTVRDVVPGSGLRFADERRTTVPGLTGDQVVLTVVDPADAEPGPVPPQGDTVFEQVGEFWSVAFEGRTVTLRDSKGMRDLATLLGRPGREHHVLDLWSATREDVVSGVEAAADGLHAPGPGEALVDARAREEYRRRLEVLGAEIADASERADTVARQRAEDERDRLVAELASAYGLGGRARRVPDEVERARKAVRRRVADALGRLESEDPVLGRHLRNAVHTGTYCSYTPERDLRWRTSGSGGPR